MIVLILASLGLQLGAPFAPIGNPGAGTVQDLEKRLAIARRRAESATAGSSEAKALADELSEIGTAFLTRGDTGRAIEVLEEAYGWNREDGLVLARLTLAYVRRKEYSFARIYLELAEEQAPRAPPEAYAVLGDVYYSLNRIEDAVIAWEQFERLGGADAGILSRLRRAREELSVSSKQAYREIGDFVFYFDTAISRQVLDRVAERLAAASRELSEFFGVEPAGQQVVILYEGRVYFALVSIPEWVSGTFDGKIRVVIDPGGAFTPELEGVLTHELTHAFIRRVSGDRAPGWLHEGLAQWFEGKRILYDEFREAVAGKTLHSLSEMEGNLSRTTSREIARSNYVEALGLVEYLMQDRGPAAVACLVRGLSEGTSFDGVLQRETGYTARELLEAWKAWSGLDHHLREAAPRRSRRDSSTRKGLSSLCCSFVR